jgi:hypothetical protein
MARPIPTTPASPMVVNAQHFMETLPPTDSGIAGNGTVPTKE